MPAAAGGDTLRGMMNHLARTSALCAIVALIAATPGTPYAAASADAGFAVKAAQGGVAEVKLAALARQKSKDATVLAFARRMTTDHTANNAQLATILKSEGMTVPSSVGADNAAVMTKLQSLSGADFDHAYLTGQVTGHQKMLALLKTEASTGSDPKLVAFAKATIPTVQQHLALAQKGVKTAGAM